MTGYLRQFSCFSQQFQRYRMDLSIYMIHIYSNSFPFFFIHTWSCCIFYVFHCTFRAFLYAKAAHLAGSIDGNGQAVPGTIPLTTIVSTVGDGTVAVTVRVWYEGCDKDCVSENALTGIQHAITGNLGFVGVQA